MFLNIILFSSLQQLKLALRKICSKMGFLWPACIIFYSALKRENTGQKKSVFWENLRGEWETLVQNVSTITYYI